MQYSFSNECVDPLESEIRELMHSRFRGLYSDTAYVTSNVVHGLAEKSEVSRPCDLCHFSCVPGLPEAAKSV